jgi:hypothetical protein
MSGPFPRQSSFVPHNSWLPPPTEVTLSILELGGDDPLLVYHSNLVAPSFLGQECPQCMGIFMQDQDHLAPSIKDDIILKHHFGVFLAS